MVAKLQVDGLRQFQRSLKEVDAGFPKMLRLVHNGAAQLVIDYARPRMPSVTGAARSSLLARSSQRDTRVAMGGRKAPYAPWLDFGGQGRVHGRPPQRPFIKDGRYVYAGVNANRDRITQIMADGYAQLARDAGLEVT